MKAFAIALLLAGIPPAAVMLVGLLLWGWWFRIPGAPFQRGPYERR